MVVGSRASDYTSLMKVQNFLVVFLGEFLTLVPLFVQVMDTEGKTLVSNLSLGSGEKS